MEYILFVGSKVKRRVRARRMLLYNLNAPVQQKFMFAFLIFLYFSFVIAGYIICQQYFTDLISSLKGGFNLARQARRQFLDLVQSMHGILLANTKGNESLFNFHLQQLNERYWATLHETLPALTHREVFRGDNYRVHLPSLAFNDSKIITIMASDVNAVDLLIALLRGAALMLGFTEFQQMSVDKFLGTAELRFVSENLTPILECIGDLPEQAISTFSNEVHTSFISLSAFLALNLGIVVGFGLFLHMKVSLL
jgi:hypothetical protein